MKHTKEPWKTDSQSGIIFGKSIGGCQMKESSHMVAQMRGWGHLKYLGEQEAFEIQIANAERIVACVNACEGITNYSLESENGLINKSLKSIHEREQLQARVKQLEEALEEIVDDTENSYVKPKGGCAVCMGIANTAKQALKGDK